MVKQQQLRYAMYRRVSNFGVTNREFFPESSLGGQAFATVAGAVTEIDQHTTTRLAGAVESRRAAAHTRATLRARLKAMARAVRELAVTDQELVKRLALPTKRTDAALLQAARHFIVEGETMKDELVRLGLPPTFVTEIRDLETSLQATLDKRIKGQETRKAGATGVVEAFDRGFRAVHTLEVIVANTLRDDEIRLATWAAARRVRDRYNDPVEAAEAEKPVETVPARTESSEPITTVHVPATTLRKVS